MRPPSISSMSIALTAGVLALATPHAGAAEEALVMQCGPSAQVLLVCGRWPDSDEYNDTRRCNRNQLIFKTAGRNKTLRAPQGFSTYSTPVGLSCGKSNNGKYYVTVEFSDGYPAGNIYDLFETNGRRLTINSVGVDKLTAKLGLPRANWARFEGND